MAGQNDSGEKTEKATPKKLQDARKKGDISKSKDMSSTLGLFFATGLVYYAVKYFIGNTAALFDDVFEFPNQPLDILLPAIIEQGLWLFLVTSILVLIPVAVVGLLIEFLQVGPLLTFEKLKPSLEKVSPVAGVKRMFGMDSFIELLKNVAKACVLGLVGYLVVRAFLPQLSTMPYQPVLAILDAAGAMALRMLAWTLAIFFFVMILDVVYQKHSFGKRMKMSMHDIKQEHKQSEGDPMIKNQRRQLQQEFASQGKQQAAADASVLVVNPTHIAVAIKYDKDEQPVPIVTAKARDDIAASMREAANESHVPVLRNELFARTLHAEVEEGDFIPRGLFDVVAEIILWANGTKDYIELQKGERSRRLEELELPEAPGEDLTLYPDQVL